MDDKKLILIDGNSLLHRAFYALPPLTTKDNLHTNGVYGFLTMLYKILDDYDPDYIGVAFDRKGPTFRHKEYEEYKAGRKKTPDELGMQFSVLKEVLDKLNIYRIELDGFEADDLVGTLAKHGEENDFEVILVTGDKDYLQLASEKTKVLITKKGITNLETYGVDEMIERYEVTPEQFIDLKGLMGDKSDNIPGVPGVGEKTGIKLLKEFESMEGIYDNIEKVSGKKLKERLVENRQQAFMSKRLATIITNVPVEIDLNTLKIEKPNSEELYKLYTDLEFNSLLNKIDKDDINEDILNNLNEEDISIDSDIQIIKDLNELKEKIDLIKEKGKFYFKLIIDGEHPLKDGILGLVFKVDKDNTYYVDFESIDDDTKTILESFNEIFNSNDIKKIGHGMKDDILAIFKNDISIKGIDFDSIISQYIIAPSQSDYSIKNLAQEYLGLYIEGEDEILGTGKKKKSFSEIELDKRVDYFNKFINILFNIEDKLRDIIEEQDMTELYYNIEVPLIEVLAFMEYQGFTVHKDGLLKLKDEFEGKINKLTEDIYEFAGEEFNINSPKQLGVILFDKLDLPVIKKTKTGYSTNAEVLEKLKGKHPIIERILEYRQIVKINSTYVDGLMALIDEKSHKVHSSFNQTITTTGRISSTEPNLQNIPIKTDEGRKIRKVFTSAEDDYTLIDADYSQIELRVLAHISDDPKLKEAFYTGEDIHTKTASEVFDVPKDEVTSLMRSRAKAVNFGIVYGISDYGLSRDLNISRKEAKTYIDNYLANYEKVKVYMESIVDQGKKQGYVETIFNRRRYLPELKSKNYNVRSFGERTAMNTPIQGSAADIIKIAMVKVYDELKNRKLKSKLILQVHDELIIEAHRDEVDEVKELLKDLMENAVELNVPLKVDMDTGDSWYDTK
ncbi:DNA polymerase I [Sporosalibacterium faouarense]|uniref:DNA polymerase I n=1 Tax=Sporosalibacterium faouarense TaxID=516123 RepID=UPI00192C5514|nr:DNA polymerase I [Sporosalibacterium faouarense]